MKQKTLLMAIAIATLLVGCKSRIEPLPTQYGDQIVAKTKNISLDIPGTKAPFEGAISGTNQLTAFVVSKLTTSGDYSTTYSQGDMIFSAPGTTAEDVTHYIDDATLIGTSAMPTGEGKLNIFAVSPAKTATAANKFDQTASTLTTPVIAWTANATGVQGTFTGIEDVLSSAAKEIGRAATNKFATFDFSHKLALASVEVLASSEKAGKAWGVIKSIEIASLDQKATQTIKNTVSITAATGEATFSGTVTTWPLYRINTHDKYVYKTAVDTLPYRAKYAAIAYTMMAPFVADGPVATGGAADNYDLSLKLVTNNDEVGSPAFIAGTNNATTIVKIELDKAFTAATMEGKKLVFKLQFNAEDITAVATVKEWEAGSDSTTPIE